MTKQMKPSLYHQIANKKISWIKINQTKKMKLINLKMIINHKINRLIRKSLKFRDLNQQHHHHLFQIQHKLILRQIK